MSVPAKTGARFLPRFLPAFRRRSTRIWMPAGRTLAPHLACSSRRCRSEQTAYHSPATSGSVCRDRVVVRFLCRVTTALRTGSDAAIDQCFGKGATIKPIADRALDLIRLQATSEDWSSKSVVPSHLQLHERCSPGKHPPSNPQLGRLVPCLLQGKSRLVASPALLPIF